MTLWRGGEHTSCRAGRVLLVEFELDQRGHDHGEQAADGCARIENLGQRNEPHSLGLECLELGPQVSGRPVEAVDPVFMAAECQTRM